MTAPEVAAVKDIIIALALIAVTAALIGIIRLFISAVKIPCKTPKAELRIYYDSDCECLEYTLERIYSCGELGQLDLRVLVVDRIGTEYSREWLKALRRKIKRDFKIVLEDESGGREEYGDGLRNR